jgi:thymidylate kinase
MVAIAFVGVDGSGKTTLAVSIGESLPFPTKYIYMGLSTLKSEPAFLTTKVIRYWKLRSLKLSSEKNSECINTTKLNQEYHHSKFERGLIWKIFRNVNYLIDVFYRLIFSFYYQLNGYLVIYDRDFLFMSAPFVKGNKPVYNHWTERALYWIFNNIYPKPGMVFFLDAPVETLYLRKKEDSVEYLEERRQAIVEQGTKTKNFINIDSSRPLDQVIEEVYNLIMNSDLTKKLRNNQ